MKPYLRYTHLFALSMSIIVLSACSSDSTNPSPIDDSPSLHDELQIVVDDAVDSGLPGVSLHVQSRDESITVVAGVVNQESAEPVTPSSLFHVASIGKTFMATMFVRLADMGYLQLDDSIDNWLDPSMSSMITSSEHITVEMLLAHTSGIQDYTNDSEYGIALVKSPGKIWTPIEVLKYIANTENHFKSGSKFQYSNTNYVLLGVIAERISGLPVGMALRQWVFDPAGLENTFGTYEDLGQPEISHGYIPVNTLENSGLDINLPTDGSDLDTVAWLKANGLGDAPIHSNPGDLNSFVRTLIDAETLVSGELKTQMLTESFPGSSEHGFGVFINDDGSSFNHSGHFYGALSYMAYTPIENLSFATSVNGSTGHYHELFAQYLNQLSAVLERQLLY